MLKRNDSSAKLSLNSSPDTKTTESLDTAVNKDNGSSLINTGKKETENLITEVLPSKVKVYIPLSQRLTGTYSSNLESYLRNLEKQYGTMYMSEHVFGGDLNVYDPYKRASEITGIPLEKDGKTPVNCGSAGKEAFNNALYGEDKTEPNNSPEELHIILVAEKGMTNTGETDQSAGLTVDFSKTTYMSYSKITAAKSWQAAIRDDSFDEGGYTYIDENGFYRSAKKNGVKSDNDYYIVAMGNGIPIAASKFEDKSPDNGNVNAGYTCRITLKDSVGNEYFIDVLVGDTKGSADSLLPHDHPLEFIVNGKPNSAICKNGNVSYGLLVGGEGETSVTSIAVYENGSLYTGSEWGGHWEHN